VTRGEVDHPPTSPRSRAIPHLFTNRGRLHDLTASRADLRAQFRWETINAVTYKLGGVTFVVGSILFFPRFEDYADLGAWIFFGGSLLYLLVTVTVSAGDDRLRAVRAAAGLAGISTLLDTRAP
jgi:hypothetical protein